MGTLNAERLAFHASDRAFSEVIDVTVEGFSGFYFVTPE